MLRPFRVATWRVDPALHTVTGPGGAVRLEPKVLAVLVCLAEHAGEVVPKERLIETVWAGTFVSDDVLTRAISELRRIFRDHARQSRVIETIPKGGYRLLATVAFDGPVVAAVPGLPRLAAATGVAGVAGPRTLALARAFRPAVVEEDAPPLERPDAARPEAISKATASQTAPVVREAEGSGLKRRAASVWTIGGVVLASVIGLGATAYLAIQWHVRRTAQPSVAEFRRITRHEVLFPPFPSEVPILTDGPRIYFNQFLNGLLRAGQVSVSGGEPVQMRFGVAQHEFVDAISPDGAELLVAGWNDDSALSDVPYWVVPVVGGAARRLGTVTGHGSHWLPDGRILFAHGHELFLVDRFGEGRVRVAAVGGRAYWPRVSPDGRRIRFARFSSTTAFRVEALWEVGIDGTGLRPLLPGWNDPPAECCGEWTRDGAFYVFQSTRQGQTHLWALRDDGGGGERAALPVQLTRGPVQFRRPIFSRDGRSILANGWQSRGELTRFDPVSGGLAPYVNGLSAEWLTHSRDGRWIAYVTYPEGELWRARPDGSERLRLTAPGVRACCVRLSPDATKALFIGERGEDPARTLVVSMDGTGLTPVDRGGEADWAPDGTRLVIATDTGLELLTLDSGVRRLIPDSKGLGSAAWSPDGRRIAATRRSGGQLVVYDLKGERWRELSSLSAGFPNWSRDGRDLYFFTGRPAPVVIRGIARWRLDTNRVEPLMDVTSLRLAWGIRTHWLGLTPQDHPLVLRELSTHDLYALEWRPQE